MLNIKKYGLFLVLSLILTALLITAVACNLSPSPTEAPENDCKHESTKWEVTKPATCTEKGIAEEKCSACNKAVKTQDIEKIAHTEEIVAGKSATCTEAGLTQGKKCSVCKAELVKQESIEALGHKSDWVIDTEATASKAGKKHLECFICKSSLETAEIPATSANHTHEGKEWHTVEYPTCAANGKMAFVCDCGHVMKTEAIAKFEHSETAVLGLSPTCAEQGKTDGKKCSLCGITTANQIAVAPKGHTFSEGFCKDCGIMETYGLWLVDGLGNPMTDIFVKVTKDGEDVKMYPYKGEFLTMDLADGNYKLELDLSQLNGKYTYDQSLCTLTPESKTASIRIFKVAEASEELFVGAPISKDYPSYTLGVGSYKVSLTPNDYTFFVFYPTSAAVYTITYECDSELAISYHGGTFFVQGSDLSEGSADFAKYENGLAVSIYSGNIGGSYVFAVKSSSAESCILNVKNAGDPGTKPTDMPWTPYTEDSAKVEAHKKVEKNGTYTTIDLTDLSLKAVFNEADGFYHLNSADGPIIFIDLTSDTKFISSLQTICSNQRMGVYIYDRNGKLTEKRSYNELFQQYGMPDHSDTKVTEAVRVPLTEKLADAIRSYGDKASWWTEGSEQNIFSAALFGAPYNAEYAWLMFCGYYA